MKYFVTIGDRTLEVDLAGHTPLVDGTPVEAHFAHLPGTPLRSLIADGRSYAVTAQAGERRGRWVVGLRGRRFTADAVDERTRAIREMTGGAEDPVERTILAPMPGLVVRVDVEVGQAVKAGQGVVVVEAMKMENELKAPSDGVVAKIHVEPRQTVEKGAVLITLE
jgi:acetyl/propionyl-CoA carboxylase alpha subunit